MALPVRRRTGTHDCATFRGDRDCSEFGVAEWVGDLHVDRHTDAEQHRVAGITPALLVCAQIIVTSCRQCLFESTRIVTAVVGRATRRREGKL